LTVGKQQVRAHVLGEIPTKFDYLFDSGREKWVPDLGEEELHDEEGGTSWRPVIGFRDAGEAENGAGLFLSDLREVSPESGSFVLYSRRRRRLGSRSS
jgi:hypothetical protein